MADRRTRGVSRACVLRRQTESLRARLSRRVFSPRQNKASRLSHSRFVSSFIFSPERNLEPLVSLSFPLKYSCQTVDSETVPCQDYFIGSLIYDERTDKWSIPSASMTLESSLSFQLTSNIKRFLEIYFSSEFRLSSNRKTLTSSPLIFKKLRSFVEQTEIIFMCRFLPVTIFKFTRIWDLPRSCTIERCIGNFRR